MNVEKKVSRRSFLDYLLTGGLAVWGLGFIAPVISYVWPSQRQGPGEQMVSAGKESDYTEWQVKVIPAAGSAVMVIRTPQGFRAFSAICTHLGCIVTWDTKQRQIICPCHGGVFDTNGKVVSGPPPRPLAEYTVMTIDGEVKVKLG